MGIAIVVEAILSFVGLSASDIATWGGMIAEGRQYVNQAWWLMALPMACVIVSVLGLNALGDGLRDSARPGQATMSALLDIRDLHLAVAGQPVLRGVSLVVEAGRVRGLVGESGAGKTMVSRVVLGIQPGNARITGGSVTFEGRDITRLDEGGAAAPAWAARSRSSRRIR